LPRNTSAASALVFNHGRQGLMSMTYAQLFGAVVGTCLPAIHTQGCIKQMLIFPAIHTQWVCVNQMLLEDEGNIPAQEH
jgi:hypothetical protein